MDRIIQHIYEDNVLGRVTNEQKELAATIPEKKERLERLKSSMANVDAFIEKARRYTAIDELTPELLRLFIQRIEIGEQTKKYSRSAGQSVRIVYRDIGALDTPMWEVTAHRTWQKKLQRKNSRGYYTITLWETVLQSPYSVDFTEEQARYQIHEDLMQHEDGKEWALSRIGICEKPDPKFCDPFEYNEIWKMKMFLFGISCVQTIRHGEEKTGFWDIILVHQKPIPQVPKDMRP